MNAKQTGFQSDAETERMLAAWYILKHMVIHGTYAASIEYDVDFTQLLRFFSDSLYDFAVRVEKGELAVDVGITKFTDYHENPNTKVKEKKAKKNSKKAGVDNE